MKLRNKIHDILLDYTNEEDAWNRADEIVNGITSEESPMISMEEYIEQHEDIQQFVFSTLSKPKFECPKCKVGGMCKRLDIVLTSYPAQYQYECNKCGHVEYLPY